ncbi:MAG: hypothetical protein JST52_04815 [Bacteroidetes bacterium]|nr:hypothetical protein [Bacteroidota bacterium]MBS1740575.1 hypothetical protein [Bacteroidota bacterium]
MGCGNCGTGKSGKPAGCKSNGTCGTSGCNRMNVFDWLSALPLSDSSKPYHVIEVSFNKGSRKEFYRNNTHHLFEKGQMITVEGVGGFDVGMVNLTGELVKLQMKKYSVKEDPQMKRILRLASEDELANYYKQKDRENEVMILSRAIAKQLNLDMKICEVEIQADGKKGTFFYTADGRVDFRELIKVYATEFKLKVEMKQIGARQESGKVGGIGSCGRELCCSTWLTDFKSVNTNAARYQNLSINQTKLSGQCGRLKCCLNYELDTYMDALKVFPLHADVLRTTQGDAYLLKKDIFKNLMWYGFKGSSKQYPMAIDQVKEILKENKEGRKPEELQPVEIEVNEAKLVAKTEASFVNDVGQISLKTLEKNSKKRNVANRSKSEQGNLDNKPNKSNHNRLNQSTKTTVQQGNEPTQQSQRSKQNQGKNSGKKPLKKNEENPPK